MKRSSPISLIIHVSIFILICCSFGLFYTKTMTNRPSKQRMALDMMRPETFKYLCPKADPKYLRLYEIYFQRVKLVLGEQFPEVYGILGYCVYQKGDRNQAVEFYKKAKAHNPTFFWYYYNLGMIYFQQQRYEEALMEAQAGLNLDLRDTLSAIMSSRKIYVPLMADYLPSPLENAATQLEIGQQTMIRLAIASKLKLEQKSSIGQPDFSQLMCY